jgi:hypothetical protein
MSGTDASRHRRCGGLNQRCYDEMLKPILRLLKPLMSDFLGREIVKNSNLYSSSLEPKNHVSFP